MTFPLRRLGAAGELAVTAVVAMPKKGHPSGLTAGGRSFGGGAAPRAPSGWPGRGSGCLTLTLLPRRLYALERACLGHFGSCGRIGMKLGAVAWASSHGNPRRSPESGDDLSPSRR